MSTRILGLLASLSVLAAGCAPTGPDRLVVATDWPAADCDRVAAEFAARSPTRLEWVRLEPGDDPTRLAWRGRAIDALLGGPESAFRRLEVAGRLDGWRIARRWPAGLGVRRDASDLPPLEGPATLAEPSLAGRVALGDPRRDPAAFAWMKGRLAGGPWTEGYAELVRVTANARRIGPFPSGAAAEVADGLADLAPMGMGEARGPVEFRPATAGERVAGVGIVRGTAATEAARAFLDLFDEAPAQPPDPPEFDGLLADLLGATLVNAQDELWAARDALARAGWPAKAVGQFTEAPPWPPASVVKMRGQAGADALLETLAEAVADTPESRDWLRESWVGPPVPLDGARLAAIAAADDGRLAANPHFRAWLAGEWTAWARQRYRRVVRRLGSPQA